MNYFGRAIAYLILIVTEIAVWGQLRGVTGEEGLMIWLWLAVLTFVATFLHELGHAAMAKALGGRIVSIAVFPFRYGLAARQFGWMRKADAREVGGYVTCEAPPTRNRASFWIAVALAGPLANVMLSGGLALAAHRPLLSHSAPPVAPPKQVLAPQSSAPARLPSKDVVEAVFEVDRQARRMEWMEQLMFALALLSLGMGIANLVPFDDSDGALIFRQWRRQ